MTDSEEQQHYKRLALVDPKLLIKSCGVPDVPTRATSASATAAAAAATAAPPHGGALPAADDECENKPPQPSFTSTPAAAVVPAPSNMPYYYRQAEQGLHPNAALHQVL